MALIKSPKIEMSQILPGLFVGSLHDAMDTAQLQNNKITHILTILTSGIPLIENSQNYKKLQLCIPDDPEKDIQPYISLVNDFIHHGRKNGSVLLHCRAGISRSVSFATAYVMTVADISWSEALKVVTLARNKAKPNFGFLQQLRIYDFAAVHKERSRLRLKYPRISEMWDDYDECQKSLMKFIELGLELKFPEEILFDDLLYW